MQVLTLLKIAPATNYGVMLALKGYRVLKEESYFTRYKKLESWLGNNALQTRLTSRAFRAAIFMASLPQNPGSSCAGVSSASHLISVLLWQTTTVIHLPGFS